MLIVLCIDKHASRSWEGSQTNGVRRTNCLSLWCRKRSCGLQQVLSSAELSTQTL